MPTPIFSKASQDVDTMDFTSIPILPVDWDSDDIPSVNDENYQVLMDALALIKQQNIDNAIADKPGHANHLLLLAKEYIEAAAAIPVDNYQAAVAEGKLDPVIARMEFVTAKEAYGQEWGHAGEGDVILVADRSLTRGILTEVEKIANKLGSPYAQEIAAQAYFRNATLAGSQTIRNAALDKAAHYSGLLAENTKSDGNKKELGQIWQEQAAQMRGQPLAPRFNPTYPVAAP